MLKIRFTFMLALAGVFVGSAAFAQVPVAENAMVVPTAAFEAGIEALIRQTTGQLQSGASAGAVFSSPAFLTVLFGLLGSLVTYFSTNGLKLSSSWLKGNRTRVLAGLISVVSAGGAAYFGLSEVAGAGTLERVLLASLSALGSFGVAVGAHETRRQAQTGLRKTARTSGALPQSPEDLLEIIKSSDIALDVRKRAVETLKAINPLAGAAAEIALNQLATRPLTETEAKDRVKDEIEERGAVAVTGGAKND